MALLCSASVGVSDQSTVKVPVINSNCGHSIFGRSF